MSTKVSRTYYVLIPSKIVRKMPRESYSIQGSKCDWHNVLTAVTNGNVTFKYFRYMSNRGS